MLIVSKLSEDYLDSSGNIIGIIFFPINEDPIVWNYSKNKFEHLKNENNQNQSHARPNNGTRKTDGTIR